MQGNFFKINGLYTKKSLITEVTNECKFKAKQRLRHAPKFPRTITMLKRKQTATPILEASSATYYTAKHTFSTNQLRKTVAYIHTGLCPNALLCHSGWLWTLSPLLQPLWG